MSDINKTQKCSQCGIEKPLNRGFFGWRNDQNKFHLRCKTCMSEYNKQYGEKNKEKISLCNKIRYERKKEEINTKKKKYRQENKEVIAAQKKKSNEKHREKIRIKKNKYTKNRFKNDENFKLRHLISRNVRRAIFENGGNKERKSILNHLRYSMQELKEHLEYLFYPWMTWENHGRYNPKTWNDNDPSTWTWQIDHIIPHSMLPYDSMEHLNFKKCWALENLRPYPAKQNVIDGVKRKRHKDEF